MRNVCVDLTISQMNGNAAGVGTLWTVSYGGRCGLWARVDAVDCELAWTVWTVSYGGRCELWASVDAVDCELWWTLWTVS